jgi:hypothetical protein
VHSGVRMVMTVSGGVQKILRVGVVGVVGMDGVTFVGVAVVRMMDGLAGVDAWMGDLGEGWGGEGGAATFSVLSAQWTPQNQSWTENWLRMLCHQSATATEEWHCLCRRELPEAAERD